MVNDKKFARNITIGLLIVLALLGTLYATGNFNFVDSDFENIQCIDTTPYKLQGYSLYEIDQYGCEIVRKNIIVAAVEMSRATDCTPGSTSRKRDICKSNLGDDWTIYVSNGNICGYSAFDRNHWGCVLYEYDYKGGSALLENECTFEEGDVLYAESFSTGETINITQLEEPSKGFCRSIPAIITDTSTNLGMTDTSIYSQLVTEEPYVVQENQRVTIFYVVEETALNQQTIQEKINIINQLELDIEEYSVIIEQLSATKSEQITIIENMEAEISEKAIIISDLQFTLDEQIELVNSLTSKVEEQAVMIKLLTDNIDEQILIIDGLQANLDQKTALVAELSAEIEYQVLAINELTSNLEEKIRMVELLSAQNIQQEAAIEEFRSLFAEQADIINAMDNTIQEDAQIINGLTSSLADQGQIISELERTTEEDALLIKELTDKTDEQATLINNLNKNLSEQSEIIEQLELSNEELGRRVANQSNLKLLTNILIGVVIAILTGIGIYYFVMRKKK